MLKHIIQQAKLFYSSSPRVRGLVKRATSSTLYYKITRAKINRQRREDRRGPFNLVIETANVCNARCVMCPYRLMKRPKKIMEQETFDKIIDRVKKEGVRINKVFFSGLGEPLTDPQIVSRIKIFKDLGFRVKLYTNASLLTSEVSQQLVDLQLDEMNISFNGVTSEQYQKVMGLDFVKTVANVDALLRVRTVVAGLAPARARLPNIRISLIITKENEEDIKKHLQNWSGKVDSVTVSLVHEWGGGLRIENCKLKIENFKTVYPCRSLWHTIVIDSSGNFVVCCRDFESRFKLGNIHTHSFTEIQNNSILKNFRRAHLNYSREKLPEMCQNCNFPYQDGVEWYLPRSID